MTVLDVFCGAGGFSEGFRQQGYSIVHGIDSWPPAIETFNFNFNLQMEPCDVLSCAASVDQIDALPDTDVIVGSPPCVSFSRANRAGKADKTEGLRLVEAFFRIVTVKKFKRHGILKAWFMENVPNTSSFLPPFYTFKDLELSAWARRQGLRPSGVAIDLRNNQANVNSAHYGSPQSRVRLFAGENIASGRFELPVQTHSPENGFATERNLKDIRRKLPAPNLAECRIFTDPLYPEIKIRSDDISDHFYDTGLYECQWRLARFLKVNHPFMGKMSFPENEEKPSRTICATNIGRETIIYASEFGRTGDGEYRTPTVREAATLMSFPLTYQFVGSEHVKWRLIGNAVCPSVSAALAKDLIRRLGMSPVKRPIVNARAKLNDVQKNLNTFSTKAFDNPPRKNSGARFRRHPFKDGNVTVTLSNYNIGSRHAKIGKWVASVQYGNGIGFPTRNYSDSFHKKLKPIVMRLEGGRDFVDHINNGFSERIASAQILQEMYETHKQIRNYLPPAELIEEVARLIQRIEFSEPNYVQNGTRIFKKDKVPVKQIFALYAVCRVCSIINSKS